MNSWIENYGIQPVADDVMVEVYFVSGEKDKDVAGVYYWKLNLGSSSIKYYRETSKLSLDDAWDEPPVVTQEYTYAQALSDAEGEHNPILTKEEQAYYKYPKTKQITTSYQLATTSSMQIERITKAMHELFYSKVELIDVERILSLYKIFEEK